MIHKTIFKNSRTDGKLGGAAFICAHKNNNGDNYNDDPIQKLDIQFCCFQDCYGTKENILLGTALFSSASNTILFYASTVKCPGKDVHLRSFGAQFDIQSDIATSRNVNSTDGYSKYCGGIEFRRTKEGFFLFQTISKSVSRYVVSFTDIQTEDLELMKSNFIENTLTNEGGQNENFPGIIFIRRTKNFDNYVKISDFCFYNNDRGEHDNARIISRRILSQYNSGKDYIYELQAIKVILENCYYSCDDNKVFYTANNFDNKNLNIMNSCEKAEKTNEIHQLLLGECIGDVEPYDKPTSVSTSTPSIPFTYSKAFSKSSDFSNSNGFTSIFFSASDNFSSSIKFSSSSKFSLSSAFSKSEDFSPSIDAINKDIFIPNGGNQEKDDKDKNKKIGMIAGIAVAAAVVVAAAIIAAVFFIKKRKSFDNEEDVETIGGDTTSVNRSNPIYDKTAIDDPFKEDFEQ